MSAYGYRTLTVITSDRQVMQKVSDKCDELGLVHSGIITMQPNGHYYLQVFPRDSKHGWPEVEEFKSKLYEVVSVCHCENLNFSDNDGPYETIVHFTVMFHYEHEGLNAWQAVIELAI